MFELIFEVELGLFLLLAQVLLNSTSKRFHTLVHQTVQLLVVCGTVSRESRIWTFFWLVLKPTFLLLSILILLDFHSCPDVRHLHRYFIKLVQEICCIDALFNGFSTFCLKFAKLLLKHI